MKNIKVTYKGSGNTKTFRTTDEDATRVVNALNSGKAVRFPTYSRREDRRIGETVMSGDTVSSAKIIE